MILRLRWYSTTSHHSTYLDGPTFGGQDEALVTGTDIFFAEAENSEKKRQVDTDFGVEMPLGRSFGSGVVSGMPERKRGLEEEEWGMEMDERASVGRAGEEEEGAAGSSPDTLVCARADEESPARRPDG